jgi:hypothetical protein
VKLLNISANQEFIMYGGYNRDEFDNLRLAEDRTANVTETFHSVEDLLAKPPIIQPGNYSQQQQQQQKKIYQHKRWPKVLYT